MFFQFTSSGSTSKRSSVSFQLLALLLIIVVVATTITTTHCDAYSIIRSPHHVFKQINRDHYMSKIPTTTKSSSTTLYMTGEDNDTNKPFAVIVKTEIQVDRIAEFLKMIEINAVESRKEPGCLRFDVVRSQEIPNQFFFYELYKNVDAFNYHKQQLHFKGWSTFKASGGTIDSITYKTDPEFIP